MTALRRRCCRTILSAEAGISKASYSALMTRIVVTRSTENSIIASFCPPSISLSVHTANGDLVDPTPCLAAGSYIVKVNEQVPVSSNPDWDWFVDNVYQTSVVNPSDGFPVSITNGETKTVSLNGRVGQCHLNAAIVLQGCSQPPGGGGSPSPTAGQPPATQPPPGIRRRRRPRLLSKTRRA